MPTKAMDARGDFRAGMITFTLSGCGCQVEFTVRFRVGSTTASRWTTVTMKSRPSAKTSTFGVTLGAFGAAMGGAGPEVRMCSASVATDADVRTSDDWTEEWCATFGYQWNTATVYGKVGSESGHEVKVTPETGHGTIGDKDETGTGGAYSIGDLQDGEYTAKATTATTGDPKKYAILGMAEVKGIELYHNEACWAATNPKPATGDERPDSCAADEVDVGEDDDGDDDVHLRQQVPTELAYRPAGPGHHGLRRERR